MSTVVEPMSVLRKSLENYSVLFCLDVHTPSSSDSDSLHGLADSGLSISVGESDLLDFSDMTYDSVKRQVTKDSFYYAITGEKPEQPNKKKKKRRKKKR